MVRILRAIAPGLTVGGTNSQLLVVEKLMPRWDEYSVRNKVKMLRREDLTMMISCGGKERSLQEFEDLATCADSRYTVCGALHQPATLLLTVVTVGQCVQIQESCSNHSFQVGPLKAAMYIVPNETRVRGY